MIFKFQAHANQDLDEKFLELFLENNIEEKKAEELAHLSKSFAFLITDSEIAHRFPDYKPDMEDEF